MGKEGDPRGRGRSSKGASQGSGYKPLRAHKINCRLFPVVWGVPGGVEQEQRNGKEKLKTRSGLSRQTHLRGSGKRLRNVARH